MFVKKDGDVINGVWKEFWVTGRRLSEGFLIEIHGVEPEGSFDGHELPEDMEEDYQIERDSLLFDLSEQSEEVFEEGKRKSIHFV